MRVFFRILLFLLLPALSKAQQTDSLRQLFFSSNDDSICYQAALRIYDYYEELNRDSAFYYGDQSVLISRKHNKKLNEAYSLSRKAYQEVNLGNYAEALNSLLTAFSICENKDNEKYYWSIDPLKAQSQKRLYALSCTHHIFGIAYLLWCIPQKVLDKRFQPFAISVICNFYFHFTTKQTGQGTGLGLSLAYDIVKAHGGEIKVNTKHEEGSEFIIQLRPN